MQISSVLKGQITKAKRDGKVSSKVFHNVLNFFLQSYPREQAKHATRKVLA